MEKILYKNTDFYDFKNKIVQYFTTNMLAFSRGGKHGPFMMSL